MRPLVEVGVSDYFGTPRIYGTYNKRTKKWTPVAGALPVPHGGVDFRAKVGTPVRVINSGRVLLVHNFPIPGTEGKMIVVDHGSGILSLYLHLSKFEVIKGDLVVKGQTIALSGATPKGTPPHLHLMVRVNDINVDPLEFIDTINKYLR